MIVALVVVFEILGLLSAVHAIMSSRTPQGSIAWAVSLITLPYVSVPAYWVFGRNKFRGYVLARQHELELIDDVIRQANDQITGVTTVGTANFDNHSFRLNFEITTVVFDADSAGKVERMFQNDFSASRLIQPDEYENKPHWFKLAVRTARLTVPAL